MTTNETKNLHDSYQTISETFSKPKTAGTLTTLTEEHEMEGSIMSLWAPTIQCVRASGDGVHGPEVAPLVPYGRRGPVCRPTATPPVA